MNDDIRGVAICRKGPQVSHLFFVDDSVLFCCATEAECQRILGILAVYERGSGQKKKTERRPIFFLAQTPKPMLRIRFKLYWGSQQFASMRNTWACQLLLAGLRSKSLSTSRRGS